MIMLMRDVYPQSRRMPMTTSPAKLPTPVKLLCYVRDAVVTGAHVVKLSVTLPIIRILGDSPPVLKAVEILTCPAALGTLAAAMWLSSSPSSVAAVSSCHAVVCA
ncbi:uncharacterized protein CCR75_009555 [Globisporangium polare]